MEHKEPTAETYTIPLEELQIDMLQDLMGQADKDLIAKRDALLASMAEGLPKAFFQCIAQYNDILKKYEEADNDIRFGNVSGKKQIDSLNEIENCKINLEKVEKKIKKLLKKAPESEMKQYLQAYYYSLNVNESDHLVLTAGTITSSEFVKFLNSGRQSLLEKLMVKSFPLAFSAISSVLLDKEEGLKEHCIAASLYNVPSSLAEVGQSYLSYIATQTTLEKAKLTDLDHYDFDKLNEKLKLKSMHKFTNEASMLNAIKQATQMGNRKALSYSANFLLNFFSAARDLTNQSGFVPSETRKKLVKMAEIAKEISQDTQVKNAINKLLDKNILSEEKEKIRKEMTSYVLDSKTGYIVTLQQLSNSIADTLQSNSALINKVDKEIARIKKLPYGKEDIANQKLKILQDFKQFAENQNHALLSAEDLIAQWKMDYASRNRDANPFDTLLEKRLQKMERGLEKIQSLKDKSKKQFSSKYSSLRLSGFQGGLFHKPVQEKEEKKPNSFKVFEDFLKNKVSDPNEFLMKRPSQHFIEKP